MGLHFPDWFDDADRAFIGSFQHEDPDHPGRLVDGAVVDGYLLVMSYVDPQTGEALWRLVSRIDLPLSQQVGLLEFAKIEVMTRAPDVLSFRRETDEDG